jgi:phospholipase/lecithinase/hemolysin
MWPEFLSTNLGLAYKVSNNYARGAAASVHVLNQATGLSAGPTPGSNLYVVWAGDSDFLYAADSNYSYPGAPSYTAWTDNAGWERVIETALNNNSNAVEKLYTKGARTIVVQNLDDFSRHPALIRDFGTDTNRVQAFRTRVQAFNSRLVSALGQISQAKPDVRILVVDMYSNLNAVESNPTNYGFTKAFPNAWDDTSLTNKSFNGPGKDYLFWDGLHATSKLNNLIADWILSALTNAVVETVDARLVQGTTRLGMNHLQVGRSYVLQESANLSQWRELTNFTATAGTNQWTDSTQAALGFYRLTWQH